MAGVSKSTASGALNSNGYVSNETRQKIEKVIKEYQYKPPVTAVSLSKQKNNIISVVIPEVDNPFFIEVLKGVTEMADENDFSLTFYDTQGSGEKELKALGMLEQQRVRDITITPAMSYGLEPADKIKATSSKLVVPIVVVDRDSDYLEWDTVYFQNYESGCFTAGNLIKAESERIGITLGNMQLKIVREHCQGLGDATASYHKVICDKDAWKGDLATDTAYDLTKRMVTLEDLPDVTMTMNNHASMGFLEAMIGVGITVGKDIVMVGIDLVPTLDALGFHLSCVSRDTGGMGKVAMKLLMRRMTEPDGSRGIWMVPCKLELKGSESKRRRCTSCK